MEAENEMIRKFKRREDGRGLFQCSECLKILKKYLWCSAPAQSNTYTYQRALFLWKRQRKRSKTGVMGRIDMHLLQPNLYSICTLSETCLDLDRYIHSTDSKCAVCWPDTHSMCVISSGNDILRWNICSSVKSSLQCSMLDIRKPNVPEQVFLRHIRVYNVGYIWMTTMY